MSVQEGLEGVVALSSDICSIIDGVLRYRGYSIDDLAANVTFEECAYLLYHKDLPAQAQLVAFKKELDYTARADQYTQATLVRKAK